MEIIAVAFKAVAPILIMMAVGYYLKKIGFFKEGTVGDLNKLSFKLLLPVFCITSIYDVDFSKHGDWRAIVFVVSSIVIAFFVSWLFFSHREQDRTRIPVLVQGFYKCNFVVMGAQIGTSIYGDDLGMIAVLFPFVTMTNNVLSVVIFEYYRGKSLSPKKIIFNVLKNPIIIGTLIGIALKLIPFRLPDLIYKEVLKKFAAMTTPVSLLALGASFNFASIAKYRKTLVPFLIVRQIIVPMILLPIGILCGLRGTSLAALTLFAAGSNAINSYPTAVMMGGDADLANEIVVFTSIACILSLFLAFCAIGATVGFY